jgi:hypothetical protein
VAKPAISTTSSSNLFGAVPEIRMRLLGRLGNRGVGPWMP